MPCSPTDTDDTLVPDMKNGGLDPAIKAKGFIAASEYDAEIMEYITQLEVYLSKMQKIVAGLLTRYRSHSHLRCPTRIT